MTKIRFAFTLIVTLLCCNVFSQSKVFENVLDIELRNTVQITNNKQIVGYAFFFKVDKMKKSALYRIEILDENLKSIGSNEFEGAKDLLLKRAVYESGQLMFRFYDEDKKDGYEKFVKLLDLKGKETGTIPYDPEKVKKGMLGAAIAAEMESIYEGTDNVEGKGFVTAYQSKAKTGGVDIQMIGTNGKLKWEKSITADKGDRTDLYLLGTTPNTILFFQMDRNSIMSAEATLFLVGLSAETGKDLFKTPMDVKGFSYEPMLVKAGTDGKVKLVSSMFDSENKFLKSKPVGISLAELNEATGELKVIKDFSFANELGNVLDMKNSSKSTDGYIKAHNVLMMDDGSMVIVGEFFRKVVNGVGMAMKILSRGGGNAAMAQIDDMFLLRIDKNLKPTALEKVEKDKSNWSIPSDGISIGLMARLLTYDGAFGYMYTDEGMSGQNKTVLARGSFGEEKYGVVALTIDPKKGYTQKRFNIEKEKHVSYYISRAKPGYVLVTKYNSKEKTVSVNLEKVN